MAYKEKVISLEKNRRLIHAVKKAGLETFHPKGCYNGYGYEQLPLAVRIRTVGEMRKFNNIKKEVESRPVPRKQTFEEKKEAWARRLVRLAPEERDLTFEEAMEIAEEKLEYKYDCLDEMINRQYERGFSIRRESVIAKMERENPLRYIKNASHAARILEAHDKHANTLYDYYLREAHELEELGVLERGTAKEYALAKIKDDPDEWD